MKKPKRKHRHTLYLTDEENRLLHIALDHYNIKKQWYMIDLIIKHGCNIEWHLNEINKTNLTAAKIFNDVQKTI